MVLSLHISSLLARDKVFDTMRKYNLDEIVSTYTTYFDIDNSNRNRNIKIAAESIDGVVVMPGEIFSFNEVVGPRTKERGYKKAPEIVNGEFVDGVGGGICQVTSTLYNSILLANLDIIKRANHSRPVSYVDLGRGATIYYGVIDFKFKNNKEYPIIVSSRVVYNQVTVFIVGKFLDKSVELKNLPIEVIEYEVIREVDDTMLPGEEKIVREGRNGFKTGVKRILKYGNKVVKEEKISNDIYQPQNAIIKYNPKD